ncbi:hypothetical protein PQR37_10385 [Paraburkholderia nemoris]|uniref:hypothetical protein n=1 Tax=Paraburkholderia TaxID=1822464 RepID=UPI0038BBC155
MNRMYGSRRREARAINSRNLQWFDAGYADVDYVAARAMSGSPLGSCLERLKFGLDRSVYGSCAELLAEKFLRRTRRTARKSLIHAALHEYLDDQCAVCGGNELAPADSSKPCEACEGGGSRTYTQAERAQMASITVDSWCRHEADYLLILDCIRSAARSHGKGMARVLSDTDEPDA